MPNQSMVPVASYVNVSNTPLGAQLQSLLMAADIVPGDQPSYELCKAIFLYHPLGAKMTEGPIRLAQSQERDISVPAAPGERVLDAFKAEWKNLAADRNILNVMTIARIYGIASIACGTEGVDPDKPLVWDGIYKQKLYFNVFDPLNTSGSLTFNQDPLSALFQKHGDITVNGKAWHRSRTCTVMNEEAIYIAWTSSSFGFVGRSVYQRALFPLKSFIQSMRTDDMIVRKAGLLVAKIESPGTIIDRVMNFIGGIKRNLIKEAETDNVLSIGITEDIQTLNMQNIDGAYGMGRDNIIKNIAVAAGEPAKLLTEEAYVQGFGEGTEDAKAIAAYIDRVRIEMGPVYTYFDTICMHRAWNPEFYEIIQKEFPEEYGDKKYTTAFQEWKNSFVAIWPSMIKENPSDSIEIDKGKVESATSVVQVIEPLVDPANKVLLIQWLVDNLNTNDNLFEGADLVLDLEALQAYFDKAEKQAEEQQQQGMMGEQETEQKEENSAKPPRPFASADTADLAAALYARLGRGTARDRISRVS